MPRSSRLLDQRCINVSTYQGEVCYFEAMLRQPVSVPSDLLDTLRAIKVAEGRGSFGEILERAVSALLASDPELARKVEGVRKAVAA